MLWERDGDGAEAEAEARDMNHLAASDDGSLLVTAAPDGRLVLWRDGLRRQTQLSPRRLAVDRFGRGGAVAVTADGGAAVVGDREGRLFVWDLAEEVLVGTLPSHRDVVNSVAVDGRRTVVSSSDDGTVHVVLSTEALADRACALTDRSLTEAEWKRYLSTEEFRPTC